MLDSLHAAGLNPDQNGQCVGLGLRRELLDAMLEGEPAPLSFLELAPENWLAMGGRSARQMSAIAERYALVCHGLSLDIGGMRPLDENLLRKIRSFMNTHNVRLYTEHLSWCGDDGHLYDLLPLPLTEEAVHWAAKRIRQTQDILGQRIGIENASSYLAPPGAEMDEPTFIRAVIAEADCYLHLDVNNIYVNSQNFNFDPHAFLQALPLEKVCYIHVAGHYTEDNGLLIDTHGADVIDPVWALLEATYQRCGVVPTCLERDNNIPALSELLRETERIRQLQAAALVGQQVAA
ncbi:MAG TPA: DUF692 domain-containing protein [Rhodocyclaceae bacterium]|nr:DUF692 domain-containing protein [Rhodocyclaceae bacterium]